MNNNRSIVPTLVIVLLVMAGIAAVLYFSGIIKPKTSVKSPFVSTTTTSTTSSNTTNANSTTTLVAEKAALTVTTVTPQIEKWDTQIAATGALAPWQEAIVSSEIGGVRVTEVLVDIGSYVKQGQVLARLSKDAILADMAQNQAAIAQAKANLADAKSNAARADRLKVSGALSRQQIEQMYTSAAVAEANLAAAQAGLDSQQIRLKHTTITAVDSGIITSRTATLGAVVQTGSEMFRLLRQGRVEWLADVPAQYLSSLQVGQTATVVLPTGATVTGKLRKIAPSLNSSTRTNTVYIALPTDSPARPGMFAQGQIQIGEAQALTIPQSALVLRDGNSYVFEIGENNIVQQRLVKTGRRQDDRVEIMEGIQATAKLVATGGAFLNEGDKVQLATANPTPAAAVTTTTTTEIKP
jgi:RND family efflux transporter MFP subunit